MAAKRRLILFFSAAILLPAALLAFFAFRSLRAERILEQARWEDAAKGFVRLAAEEVHNTLAEWAAEEELRLTEALTKNHERPAELVALVTESGELRWPRFSSETVDLRERVLRERADLANLFDHAEQNEYFVGDTIAASRLYQKLAREVEHPTTRSQLGLRTARSLSRAGEQAAAETILRALFEDSATHTSESGLPLVLSAGLALVETLPEAEREPVAAEILQAVFPAEVDPFAELFALRRLGALCPGLDLGDRIEKAQARADVLSRARSADFTENVFWFAGGRRLWAGIRIQQDQGGLEPGTAVALVSPDPFPSENLQARIDELAKLGNLNIELRWGNSPAAGQAEGAFEEVLPESGIRLVATMADPGRWQELLQTRSWVFGGLILLCVAAMAAGFVLTLRALGREARLAELKSDFLSNVTHEFRTPLTSIRMFAELLQNPIALAEEKRAQYVAIIEAETGRLGKMVERLLDFARLESGKQTFQMEPQDLRQVVRGTVERFRPGQPEFRFSLELPIEEVRCPVDAEAIERALGNLLDNAVKYSPDRRAAEVILRAVNSHARVEVRDQGTGIDPKDLPFLFEKFSRGTNPLVNQIPGTGLGLAFVRHIAEAHRGRVGVESQPGRGSTFTIEIPLWRESS